MTTDAPERLEQDGISVDLNSRVQFMVGIPAGLMIELDKFAKSHGTTKQALGRKALADIVGFTLPAGGKSSPRKYSSEEERKKAQLARNKARRDLVNSLLKQYIEEEDEDEDEEDE